MTSSSFVSALVLAASFLAQTSAYNFSAITIQCDNYLNSTKQSNVCNYDGVLTKAQVTALVKAVPKTNATACRPHFLAVLLKQALSDADATALQSSLFAYFEERFNGRANVTHCDKLYTLLIATGNANDTSKVLKSKFGAGLSLEKCQTENAQSLAAAKLANNGPNAAAQEFLQDISKYISKPSSDCPVSPGFPSWAYGAIVAGVLLLLLLMFCVVAVCCCGATCATISCCLCCCAD